MKSVERNVLSIIIIISGCVMRGFSIDNGCITNIKLAGMRKYSSQAIIESSRKPIFLNYSISLETCEVIEFLEKGSMLN